MEAGNMLFGNSRGRFVVERDDEWYELLVKLFSAYAPDRDNSWREYGVAYENATFRVFPYYWGDCTCGYTALAEAFSTLNEHDPSCYSTYLYGKLGAYDEVTGYGQRTGLRESFDIETNEPCHGVTVQTMTPKPSKSRVSYKERDRMRTKIQKEACARFNIPWNDGYGCMCHCTCAHDANWKKWSLENDHKADCPIVIPNFHYKPTDFRLDWYKYPLRDSYASQELTTVEFRSIIDRCIASLA